MKSTIFLATDHAGFELKEKIKAYLIREKYDVQDLGASQYDEYDDYPIYMKKAGEAVSQNPNNKAIIFGKSGNGEAMVANRYKNVRAAVWYGGSTDIVKLSREHNNANILSIGAGFISEEEAEKAIKIWLEKNFNGEERHVRRIAEIDS